MFYTGKPKYLRNFLKDHPDLNDMEKSLIATAIQNMDNPEMNQFRELMGLTKSLQKLSLNSHLSDAGRVLLTKLQRSQWIWSFIYHT
jgi:hypothetical protein